MSGEKIFSIPTTAHTPKGSVESNGNGNGHGKNGNGHKEVNGYKLDKSLNIRASVLPETEPASGAPDDSMPFSEAFSGQNLKDYLAIFEKDFGVGVHMIGHTNSQGEHDYPVYQVDFQHGGLIRLKPGGTDGSFTFGTSIQIGLKDPQKPQGRIVLSDSSNREVARHSLDEAVLREIEGDDGTLRGIEFTIPASEKNKPSTVVTLAKQDVHKRNKVGEIVSTTQVLFTKEEPVV